MARVPIKCDGDGCLHFRIGFNPEEEIRFSYGVQSEILSKVKGNSLEFEAFASEAMFLVVCLNPADLRQAYRSVSLAFDKLDWDALQNLAF